MNNNRRKRKIFDGKYEIFGIIGTGPSSVVYHAKDLENEQEVAIKALVDRNNVDKKQVADSREQLRKESLSLVSCRHNNVIKLIDFKVIDKLCYLVMEYAPHNNIVKYLNGEVLQYAKGEKYLMQMLDALDFIHKVGFIHRDIGPENLLVFDNDVIKLGDFGTGEVIYELNDINQLKNNIRKKDFVAPEYFNDDNIGFHSDIYSLGATFFYLFTHSKSFNTDLIKNKKLSYCLKKMLAPNPNDRFKLAAEVMDFLHSKSPTDIKDPRRLTRDHIEDIASLEEDFENFNKIINDTKESAKQKEVYNNKFNYRETLDNSDVKISDIAKDAKENIEDNSDSKVYDDLYNKNKGSEGDDKNYKGFSARDVTKMTLKEINKEKLDELEREKQKEIKGQKANEKESKVDEDSPFKSLSIRESDKKDNNKQVVYKLDERKLGRKKRFFLYFLFLLSILFLLYSYGIFDKKKNNDDTLDLQAQSKASLVTLSFPNLPNGKYSGEFYKIIFNKIPFTISSKDGNLVFRVMLEGFDPVIFDNSKSKDVIEVKFNGLILVLKADTISKSVIKGVAVNKITGEKGTFVLKYKG